MLTWPIDINVSLVWKKPLFFLADFLLPVGCVHMALDKFATVWKFVHVNRAKILNSPVLAKCSVKFKFKWSKILPVPCEHKVALLIIFVVSMSITLTHSAYCILNFSCFFPSISSDKHVFFSWRSQSVCVRIRGRGCIQMLHDLKGSSSDK